MSVDPFRRIALVASAVTILIGLCGLSGWLFDLQFLKTLVPGMPMMQANTACGFLLAGTSLSLQLDPDASPAKTWAAHACALLVLALGTLTLAEHVLGVDLRIDQALLRGSGEKKQMASPGRMVPTTALNLALLGGALLSLNGRHRTTRLVSQTLTLLALLVAFVAFARYGLEFSASHSAVGYTRMAIHTVAGFGILSIGLLTSHPDIGVMIPVSQDNPAGHAARRILPMILATPLVLGWLRLEGQRAGLYGLEFGHALMVTATTCILAAICLWNARVQGVMEMARQQELQDDRFLLELSELLRISSDSSATLYAVCKSLGEYLGVSRCHFNEISEARGSATIHRDYCNGLPSLAGRELLLSAASSGLVEEARAGRCIVTDDASVDPRTAREYERKLRPLGLRARIAVPFVRHGEWISTLVVSSHERRQWQKREIALAEHVAERTWLWFEHLRSLEDLRRGDARKAAILGSAFDAIVSMDHRGIVIEFNAAAEKLFGYAREEVVDRHPVELLIPPSPDALDRRSLSRYLESGGGHILGRALELPAMRADGSQFTVELALARVEGENPPIFTGFFRDVSARKHVDRERESLLSQLRTLNGELEERVRGRTTELTARLKEREILLQEVHHRVKNNLQIISSLINMQTRKLEEGASRDALEECRARIQTIALIHEKLYESKNYSSVPFPEYARGLAANVFLVAGVSSGSVSLELAIEDVALAIDRAIPCGLVLNELITNALKHGFPEGRRGTIRVALGRLEDGRLKLSVTDDGLGLPADFDIQSSDSLGLQLVRTLSEQLDGTLEMNGQGGTSFQLTFRAEG